MDELVSAAKNLAGRVLDRALHLQTFPHKDLCRKADGLGLEYDERTTREKLIRGIIMKLEKLH